MIGDEAENELDHLFGGPINRFGEREEGEWSTRSRPPSIRTQNIEGLLARVTDQQLAVACYDVENAKIASIVNWHFKGSKLSDKQRWCLAAHCYDHELEVKA
jgi:hypothetical protein